MCTRKEDKNSDSGVVSSKRVTCTSCSRPANVCLCEMLPKERMSSNTCVVIVQSRAEAKAKVKTAGIVTKCMSNARIVHSLKQVEEHIGGDAVLLFPGDQAISLKEACVDRKCSTIVLVDGTWDTAKRMIRRSAVLQSLQRAFVPAEFLGQALFRARKAPTGTFTDARSTAEAVAGALLCIEGDSAKDLAAAIRAGVHAASEMQLKFIREKGARAGKHRVNRRGYQPGLYDEQASQTIISCSVRDEEGEQASAQAKRNTL